MKTEKKKAKNEKTIFGRIVWILDMLWDLFTLPKQELKTELSLSAITSGKESQWLNTTKVGNVGNAALY